MAVRTLARPDAYAGTPEKKLTLYMLMLGFVALLIGTLFAPLRASTSSGFALYPYPKPLLQNSYKADP